MTRGECDEPKLLPEHPLKLLVVSKCLCNKLTKC